MLTRRPSLQVTLIVPSCSPTVTAVPVGRLQGVARQDDLLGGFLSYRAETGSCFLRVRCRGRGHEFDSVPPTDCRHLDQVVRNRADLVVYILEKR